MPRSTQAAMSAPEFVALRAFSAVLVTARTYLLLDGILGVWVDGTQVAELGPGAVAGERALLEHGRRTATLRAVTSCVVATAPRTRAIRTASPASPNCTAGKTQTNNGRKGIPSW
jgi:hypothetical protein